MYNNFIEEKKNTISAENFRILCNLQIQTIKKQHQMSNDLILLMNTNNDYCKSELFNQKRQLRIKAESLRNNYKRSYKLNRDRKKVQHTWKSVSPLAGSTPNASKT